MVDLTPSDCRSLAERHGLAQQLEDRIQDGGLRFFERPNPYFSIDHNGQALGVKVLLLRYVQTFLLPEVEQHVARVQQGVHHPQLVQYLGCHTDRTAGQSCIWMQHIPGRTLRDAMNTKGAGLPEYEVRERIRNVCTALAVLHEAGIVHGKLDASKVMLSDTGQQVLIDYVTPPGLYLPQCACAPIHCLAPEIATLSPYGRAADVWSVGTLVLELVAHTIHWAAVPDLEAFLFSRQPVLPAHIAAQPLLSKAAMDFVLGCLCRSPADRLKLCELQHHPFLHGETAVLGLLAASTPSPSEDEADGAGDPTVALHIRPSSRGYTRKASSGRIDADIVEEIGGVDEAVVLPSASRARGSQTPPGKGSKTSAASGVDRKNAFSPRRLNSSLQLPRTTTSR
eukprot:GGOE01065339.1.p1 GENE.GGOE01065339.1~~GGOE01065339.1.p1  ORF type:complete len:404 (+),score=112.20 GGOE01065339.1:25-1212(+)